LKRLLTVLALTAALLSAGAEKLRIADATGSDGGALPAALLKLFAEHPEFEISCFKLDAETALEKFAFGDFDVVLINGGDLPPDRRKTAFRYAVGAYIAVVSVKNPLRKISAKDLRMIVDAPRAQWELVGGSASTVHRYGVSSRDGKLIGAAMLKLDTRAREITALSSMDEAILLAENDPEALVWGPFMPELPITVVALEVDGAAPTRANIRSGAYPLSVSRFALSSAEPGRAARAFLTLLRSGEFARLLEDDGEISELPELR
jgi:hypothetical protein